MKESQTGLIAAYLLDGAGSGRRLDWKGVQRWQQADGILWVHLDYSDGDALSWLSSNTCLPEIAAQALGEPETRPRCTLLGGGLLLSLRGVNSNPGADPEDMVSLRIWASATLVVTTRRRRLMSVQAIFESLDAGEGPAGTGDVLVAVAGRMVEKLGPVLEALEDRVDALEEVIVDGGSQELRPQLSELRRESIMLRRYLAPQREAMARLHAEPVAWMNDIDRLRLREITDEVMRYVEDLDALRDRGGVAYEELSSRLAEQMNERMYLLSVVAGMFLPLGFVTGLLGINVGGIPAANNPWGFAIVVTIIVGFAIAQWLFFKARHWV